MNKKLLAIVFAVGFTVAFAACGGNSDDSSQNPSPPDSSVCSHVYDNACDAVCNECGDERTAAEHVYDNEYDATCNECGGERVVPEDPVNGGNWTGEAPLK